jgi:tRNA pseudouridine38-40 synthase
MNLISECNFGTLQKIGWMRASRTDKKVSAIMNVVSCKLHKHPDMDEDEVKKQANLLLPQDIKIFRIIEVSRSFDSKATNNNREYHYILPAYMLEPRAKDEEKLQLNDYKPNYLFKISTEYHEKIKEVCKFFKGSKKYHNYTKKLTFNDASAVRHIYEFSCNEIINFENFQVIKFTIIGQSFLYNQIRKMIGSIIEVCREMKDSTFLENSLLSNKMDIPKAPAEGLYLRRIDYTKYNDRKVTKKNLIFLSESDEREMEEFRTELVTQIEKFEIEEKAFSKWLWAFDNYKQNIY